MSDAIIRLPKSWQLKKLGDVCDKISNGSSAKQYDEQIGFPIARIETISNQQIDINRVKYIRENDSEFLAKYALKDDDILFSHINSDVHLGKTAIYSSTPKVLIHGINLLLLRVNKLINPVYFNFYLNYLRSTGEFISIAQKSVNQSSINQTKLKNVDIVLPPLPTQKRIVAKIEELFSELDKGVEKLKTAQHQLKIYRQSLLKAAFEGRLTNKNVKEGELPKGWERVELKNICEIKRGKSKHRPRNEPKLFGGKYPFIQTGDIRDANGGYITKHSQTYSEMGLLQSKLWPKGTLCITIAANIGETAILSFDACFPDSVVGLLCNEKVLLNKYLNYFFISFKSKLEEMAPATAQKNINVDILEKVQIPLANIKEQMLIVAELEELFEQSESMRNTLTDSLQQIETLRQSILKQAFEGRLVEN